MIINLIQHSIFNYNYLKYPLILILNIILIKQNLLVLYHFLNLLYQVINLFILIKVKIHYELNLNRQDHFILILIEGNIIKKMNQ